MDGRRATRRRVASATLVVAGHAAVLVALLSVRPGGPPDLVEIEPIPVAFVTLPPPPPPPGPELPPPDPEPEPPAPKAPAVRRLPARPARVPPPPAVAPLAVRLGPLSAGDAEVGEAELAGAATAGTGSGGGGCNMVRHLESALRKDRMVQSAVAGAHRGKALRVWNGDWVRHGAEEGAGLAAVREAIQWEVGFAPPECKRQSVKGLVVLALNDTPGGPRLVLGQRDWRWSDLLFAKR